MRCYSSKEAKRGKTAYRTPSEFRYKKHLKNKRFHKFIRKNQGHFFNKKH